MTIRYVLTTRTCDFARLRETRRSMRSSAWIVRPNPHHRQAGEQDQRRARGDAAVRQGEGHARSTVAARRSTTPDSLGGRALRIILQLARNRLIATSIARSNGPA
jgi:hypothetical protein